jgi:hypothetical protein
MKTLIKKILHEQDKKTLNEPLEIGDFIKVIDIGYSDDVHWGRGGTPGATFKMPKLYELYEVIDKGIINATQEPFYLLLNPDDKEEHVKVKGFREGNMLEKLLYPSLDTWLKVEENEVLEEQDEKRKVDPPIKEGDFIIVIDQDDDRWEPSKTIPRDPSGMSGRANMIEYVKNNAPELYTKYEVGEYIPYESRWWPFEIPIWKLWKEKRGRMGGVTGRREETGGEARLYPYAHTYIKAEDNEILSEEKKRPQHFNLLTPLRTDAPWMDLDVGDEVVVVDVDKKNLGLERGRDELPELYTSYIVISSHPYAVHNHYTIVDKDVFDEALETQWGANVRWGNETKILFQAFDEFILREKED